MWDLFLVVIYSINCNMNYLDLGGRACLLSLESMEVTGQVAPYFDQNINLYRLHLEKNSLMYSCFTHFIGLLESEFSFGIWISLYKRRSLSCEDIWKSLKLQLFWQIVTHVLLNFLEKILVLISNGRISISLKIF